MRLFSLFLAVAHGAGPEDPCTLLCIHHGRSVCTGGSWTKPDGTCQAYLYRGDPSLNDVCYHTAASAATCPSRGRPVRAADVARLLGLDVSTSPPTTAPTTATSTPTNTAYPSQVGATTMIPEEPVVPTGVPANWLTSVLAVVRSANETAYLHQAINGLDNLNAGVLTEVQLPGLEQAVGGLMRMASVWSRSRQDLVRMVLVLATRMASRVPNARPSTSGLLADISRFCNEQAAIVRAVMEQDFRRESPRMWQVGPTLIRLCPEVFNTRQLRLGSFVQSVWQHFRSLPLPESIRLLINRSQAFSESINVVNGASVSDLRMLPEVNYRGEAGNDRGGLGRDWFATVAALIFSSQSSDPMGALFAPSDGTDFIQLNLSRPYSADMRAAYYAVGRILAMSVIQQIPIGVPLPRMFFSRLLGRPVSLADVELDDPALYWRLMNVAQGGERLIRASLGLDESEVCPTPEGFISGQLNSLIPAAAEERIGAIRDGFHSVLPVASVGSIITSDDLRSLVYGTPEISVSDLVAHTRYDGVDFTAANEQIQWMWDWLRRSDNHVRRQFVRFITGLSQLPVDGMAGLQRGIYIRPSRMGDLAPRSHTCSFSLDMPVYRSAAELEEWMSVAVASDGFGME